MKATVLFLAAWAAVARAGADTQQARNSTISTRDATAVRRRIATAQARGDSKSAGGQVKSSTADVARGGAVEGRRAVSAQIAILARRVEFP